MALVVLCAAVGVVPAAASVLGVNWRPAPVADGQATVTHPDRDGYVSLRATAVDAAGNTVTQTVIRAYKLAA